MWRTFFISYCAPKLKLCLSAFPLYLNLDNLFCFHCECPIGSTGETESGSEVRFKKRHLGLSHRNTQCHVWRGAGSGKPSTCSWWLGVRRCLAWLGEEGKDDKEDVFGLFLNFFLMRSVCEKRFDASSWEICADDLERIFWLLLILENCILKSSFFC